MHTICKHTRLSSLCNNFVAEGRKLENNDKKCTPNMSDNDAMEVDENSEVEDNVLDADQSDNEHIYSESEGAYYLT